ncbi:uncharacterized protein N7477_007054 [Penicillium maclennaniae]|uniref:uncharacterized protein n=1 Tax=Penicillium maclennaniae TaxID=1343394 RepID=UPI00254111BA|nr:uncharacterized protein N7477_007054 [Penicillium maclennaniae]KAJ5668484.1 hypothetical protein N7477_007054 [Penicillium maclennaniae]
MASQTRNVLFFTNSELGQCNVALAVAEEFLRRGKFRVHFASFNAAAPLVQELNTPVVDTDRSAEFHEIFGPSMTDLAVRSMVGLLYHPPGIKGATEGFIKVSNVMSNWKPTEYARAYRSCLEILEKVRPSVVVIDPILHVGLDACEKTPARKVILWPVPIKDVVVLNQPKAGVWWKYPVTGSGYPFPLPWKLVLSNIYLVARVGMALACAKSVSDEQDTEKAQEERSPFPLRNAYSKDTLSLTPAFPEMDFPFRVPNNVISCGPIVRQCQPLAVVDPELSAWLNKPTVLISLGSHVKPCEQVAVQMAKAIRKMLYEYPDMQVLWKLQYNWETSPTFQNVLGSHITAGSVLVTPWIQPDIMSVLETGQIVAYVHHGGANSYFEACKVGVPQVVLPQWLDTYDCATRVEWLGIGINGSRTSAPGIDATEFAKALIQILRDADMRSKANVMKEICSKTEGRVMAHDQIVDFCTME